MKKIMILLLIAAIAASFCSALSTEEAGQTDVEWFSDRDSDWSYDEDSAVRIALSGNTGSCSHKAVEIDGSMITIMDEGVFIISGTLNDGMICVLSEKKDKVQIVLDNAQINSAECAPIYVRQADKVFVTLAEGSVNSLSNGGAFEQTDDNNVDAVIFSKEDLTLNGTGALTIASPAGHGVVSKDALVITGGSYTVDAAGHGFSGKDSIAVAGGEMVIRSGKDGIHSENSDDAEKGNVCVTGGSFSILSEGDGMSASGSMEISGGVFDIVSGGGSAEGAQQSGNQRGGFMGRNVQQAATEDTPSAKGVKSAGALTVSGGSFDIDASDDALHSDADVNIFAGELGLSTGDDGIHADNRLTISGGSIDILQSYEGIEAKDILISGGDIALVSDDDGLNAGGGNDASGYGGHWGGDMFSSDGSSIAITGGTITVNAEGDGVDSNGDLSVSGGVTIVHGPVSSGNGPLDYAGKAVITGGTFAALGSGQMAMNFSAAENQGAMLVSTDAQAAGTQIVLADSDGKEIFSVTGAKSFSCAVISCPEIAQGETYSLTAGGYSVDVTMDSLLYGTGSGMMGGRGGMGGKNGMGGGFGGRGRRG